MNLRLNISSLLVAFVTPGCDSHNEGEEEDGACDGSDDDVRSGDTSSHSVKDISLRPVLLVPPRDN